MSDTGHGPAFPTYMSGPDGSVAVLTEGLSKREYFIGQALIGAMCIRSHPKIDLHKSDGGKIVQHAIELADLLLLRLEQGD